MPEQITLYVGQVHHLGSGKDRIIYAGMVSEDVYSIVQRKRNFAPYAVWGYAWNLFFPKKKQDLIIDGVNITVENVTPEEIRLRVG